MTSEPKSGVAEFRKGDRCSGLPNDVGERIFGRYARECLLPGYAKLTVEGNPNYPLVLVASLRHEPAEQKAWEPKCGEECEGIDAYTKELFRGQFMWWSPENQAALIPSGHGSGRMVTRESLRPVQDPPPARASADEPAAHGPECCCNACYLQWKERPKPGRADPYAEHREVLAQKLGLWIERDPKVLEEHAAYQVRCQDAARLSAMTLRERRKSEALRMLDRPMAAPKYPDGVLWEAFSTPGWES